MTSQLLALEDVSVSFGGLKALQNISLELNAGEVVGVIGPNGAGKSTLFNAISGLVQTSGNISLFDNQIPWPKPHELTNLGISRTLQGVGLFGDLTVLENVMIGTTKFAKGGLVSAALGFDTKHEDELRKRSLNALGWVGCRDFADQRADSLPYPTTKRISIARALVNEPKILLLDEPAGGLGSEDINWLNQFVRDISRKTSVILVEHHMDVVMTICDRIYVLNFGQLIAKGTPAEVRNNPAVIEAYLGGSHAAS